MLCTCIADVLEKYSKKVNRRQQKRSKTLCHANVKEEFACNSVAKLYQNPRKNNKNFILFYSISIN